MRIRILHLSLIGAFLFLIAPAAIAQVRESTDYRIQSDSINIGGALSTSSGYRLEDTTGEIATGESTSASFNLRAGYQQMQEIYLALAGGGDVAMSPALGGITGGESDGSVTFTATTDNAAGYQLRIRAEGDPAMQKGGDAIADYAPPGGIPEFAFTTDATEAHLGFSPEGADIVDRFRDDGADCDVDTGDTALRCWDGLSQSDQTIASASSGNHPSGTDTTIRFRVGIGGSVVQPEGTYVATTTVTLLAL